MTRFSTDAEQFKKAFEDARKNNAELAGASTAASHPPDAKEESEEAAEPEGEAEGNAPAPTETNPPAAVTQASEKTGEE